MQEEKPKKVWDKSANWPEEIHLLKSFLSTTELTEEMKWGAPTYTLNQRNVIGVAGFKDFVSLWFWNGVFLKDSKKKLINASPGQTKGLRQWRFKNLMEIQENEEDIRAYIQEAIANEKAGLCIKPEKKQTHISEFMQSVFDSDTQLKKAFDLLTPGRQREYLEYIDTAKQERTKLSRLQTIRPTILEGKGMNDKYRK